MSYEPILPPNLSGFSGLTEMEAKAKFDDFVRTIPGRIDRLKNEIALVEPNWIPDFSEASLLGMGKWLKLKARARYYSQEERERIIEKEKLSGHLAQWTREMTSSMDDETWLRCNNVGVYFAEALRHAAPGTAWSLCRERRNEDCNYPVLVQSRRENRFHYPELNPVTIGASFGNKFISFDSGPEIVCNAFLSWSKWLKEGYTPMQLP